MSGRELTRVEARKAGRGKSPAVHLAEATVEDAYPGGRPFVYYERGLCGARPSSGLAVVHEYRVGTCPRCEVKVRPDDVITNPEPQERTP